MKLIITEKPSVAKDIARVLNINKRGNGYIEGADYIITWCVGHLIQLAMPQEYDAKLKVWNMNNLPIFPTKFKYEINPSTKDQYYIIKSLIEQERVDEVICATDAGREGQLIFGYVYINVGVFKPVKRLWISSMTDQAISEGFLNLRDNKEYFPLYQSAKSRSEADWLVGINATRLYSLKYNTNLTIGRVQTPTLAMIVNRQRDIDNFVSEPFYEVEAEFENFSALWFNEDGTRLKGKPEAQAIIDKCEGKEGIVSKVAKKKSTIERPLLYDLTELQRDGNKKYGYTAEQTLEAAQTLYEKYKLTTYPRTDSRYLTADMKPKLTGLLMDIKEGYAAATVFIDNIIERKINADKRVIDDKKVTDHHAIIVTSNIKNLGNINLPQREKDILTLVMTRFIVALDRKQEYEQTDIEVIIDEENFKAKGKKIIVEGWKEIEDTLLGKSKEDAEDKEIKGIIKKGDKLNFSQMKLLEKKTSPPKLYNEATLLTAMETAGKQIEDEDLKEEMKTIGLGTPATRAGIIEKLISVGYIKRNKKNILPTENGIKLIEIVPEKLKKPDLTGEWEKSLEKITKGEEKAKDFIFNIKKYVAEIVREGQRSNRVNISFDNTNTYNNDREVIAKCPKCGQNIYESNKSFYCEGFKNYPQCKFSFWREDKFLMENNIILNKIMIKDLVEKGETYIGNDVLSVDMKGRYINYSISSAKKE